MTKKITLAKVKEFANKIFWDMENMPEELLKQIGFEFNGMWIINVWIDDSGRFELTDEKAIDLYGKENVDLYIKNVKEYLKGVYQT